jgi:hypothetical protein
VAEAAVAADFGLNGTQTANCGGEASKRMSGLLALLERIRFDPHAARLATVWPQLCEDGDIGRRTSPDDRWLRSRKNETLAYGRGCPRTRVDDLLIRRLWVRVPPLEHAVPQVSAASA